MSELQSALAAAERVFNMIDEPTESPDREHAAVLDAVKGNVVLKNVCFGYTQGNPIIRGLNLHAQAGKLVAIVTDRSGKDDAYQPADALL